MTDAVTLTLPRLATEEGFRSGLYDDATGLPVKAPVGNATIGYGFNAQAGISQGLASAILQYQLGDVLKHLQQFAWFGALDPARASVLLDVAFNAGVSGLLHFPHMLAAVAAGDWSTARDELLDSDAARALPGRYGPLAELLLNGQETPT